MSVLAKAVEHLKMLDLQGLKSEIEDLLAIREWALANLGIDYATGDRVQIVSPKPSQTGGGWACYAEALAVGQTGVAGEISFSRFARSGWYVLVGMDRSWSTHEDRNGPTRMWNGPAAEVPAGHTLPGGYPPEGRTKNFSMPVDWVRKAVL